MGLHWELGKQVVGGAATGRRAGEDRTGILCPVKSWADGSDMNLSFQTGWQEEEGNT